MRNLLLAAVAGIWGTVATAEVPKVAVDILPVHAMAAKVMQGLGEPTLVVRPGASPHGYAMRPSEARAVQEAQAVFFVSGNLTRWFERALAPLQAAGGRSVELLESEGTTRLTFREETRFAGSSRNQDEHGHDEDHDDGHEEDQVDQHDDLAEDGGDDETHVHYGPDPHGWLDPENAKIWMAHMAETLAEMDPENADIYRSNAREGQGEIDAAMARAQALLQPVHEAKFVVFHDAYQYFQNRFDLHAVGAISSSDAEKPGPRRVAELREMVAEEEIVCVFAEPQFNHGLIDTVFDGGGARVAQLDPLGVTLEAGPEMYPALIDKLAQNIAVCLGGE
ncbi:zinc ABC transporter substrate-binding protein [Alisedimentitalea sp. MJ-SS2]|uniref:zinc ABC transporter substrate-binding protein n=1 Tax=Aliisedimentitalea sp. MJ-SS2 TaxID=3049795 RepID=UPI00290C834E|nr:zinc ABC transporter substrate-binding protein [Alisedimentitalea sp. MJ-SS2]MDU8925803.1 zinc ABC transporter substrate-binding protein [Alisedimentitalea sp. MJ-SS2]